MKLKKVLALSLAAVMTFSLAGCGSSDGGASTGDTSSSSTGSSASTSNGTEGGHLMTAHQQRLQVFPDIWISW